MDKLWDILLFLPQNSKLHLSLLGVRSIYMESIGTVAMRNIQFEKKMKKLKGEFFAKGYEKCKILSEILENRGYKLG